MSFTTPRPAGLHAVLLAGLAATLLAGCLTLEPARLALPDGLADRTEIVVVEGLGAGERGRFAAGPLRGHYERRATRLDLFDLLSRDRVATRYVLEHDGTAVDCTLRETTLAAGAIEVRVKPLAMRCDFSRAGQPLAQQLELRAGDSALGTRLARVGRMQSGGIDLELRSLHEAEGGAWPLAAPLGYAIRQAGRDIAAVEVDGLRPRVWLPRAAGPERDAALLAALTLALLWDPATHGTAR